MLDSQFMESFQGFTISMQIGSGATSDVYLGLNTKGEKRALKVFNQFLPEEQGDITFKRELENLEKLRNDKVVRVYGLEKSDSGKWVLIQEYIDGIGLEVLLKSSLSDFDRVVLCLIVASEVLYALEESHSKGIVHRDIKPENILLDSTGRIVLTDFGLSKDINLNDKTLHGNLFGSPQYMSLKQFGNKQVTEEVDLYSIAVLIYEIAGATPPFSGQNIEEIITAKKENHFKSLDKLNMYTPIKLVELVNSILGQKENNPSFDKAYKLRFELLNILSKLKVDVPTSIRAICLNEKILPSKDEASFISVVLNELEERYDPSNDKMEKGLLLGRILKLDSENERGYEKSKKKSIFVIFIFLAGLSILMLNKYQAKEKAIPIVPEMKVTSERIELPRPAVPVIAKPLAKKEKLILKPNVGYLIVNIPSDIKVFVDDKRIYRVGKKLPYPVGEHEVTLSKDGYKSMSYKIKIQSKENTVIKLD